MMSMRESRLIEYMKFGVEYLLRKWRKVPRFLIKWSYVSILKIKVIIFFFSLFSFGSLPFLKIKWCCGLPIIMRDYFFRNLISHFRFAFTFFFAAPSIFITLIGYPTLKTS